MDSLDSKKLIRLSKSCINEAEKKAVMKVLDAEFLGMGIDVKTRKTKINTVFGGLSGPAIKPIALANVHKIYKSVNIPIIGLGGIKSVNDILEFILAGADLIQIGTLN